MKFVNGLLKFFSSAFFVGLVITLALATICLRYYVKIGDPDSASALYQGLNILHLKSIDWRLKQTGAREPDEQVAVLAVDDAAINKVGRWPWSRDKMAQIMTQLKTYGAKVVAFDIVYSEKDQTSAGPALVKLKDHLKSRGALPTEVMTSIDQEINESNGDQKFADVIAGFGDHMVLGAFGDPDVSHYPFQDACIDLYFQKTSVFRGWDREAVPLVVNENPLQLPDPIAQQADLYMQGLALKPIHEWLPQYPAAQQSIRLLLQQVTGKAVSQDHLERLILGWQRQDTAAEKQILASYKPSITDDEIKNLNTNLNTSMENMRGDLLERKIMEAQNAYCFSFLIKDDPAMPSYAKAWPAFAASSKDYTGQSLEDVIDKIRYTTLKNPVNSVSDWTMNIPLLQNQMKNVGVFDAKLDSDGVIRSNRLFSHTGTKYIGSIGLKAFLVAKNYNLKITLQANPKIRDSKYVSEVMVTNGDTGDDVFKIPTDNQGQMMINYVGRQKMFPHLRASDLLDPKPTAEIKQRVYDPDQHDYVEKTLNVQKADFIKDKIFVFGVTATGVFDMRVTPFEENYPGVETHANVVDNLLTRNFLKVNPQEEMLMPLFILTLGLILSYVLGKLGAVPGFAVAAVSLGGLAFVDKFYLFKKGTVVAIVFPLSLVVILYVFLTFFKYFTEERKKKELKGTFEKYVSPAIVQEILSDPANLQLGGRKEIVTVFFSDVRGFTTISEKLDPSALTDLLNSYLTPMTRLVFENKGTLDKYMGDAIMAFFGAPVHYPDHAKHACRCALSHLKKLKELQAEYERKGLPIIDIGIGLNTGEANVGNMGSDIVRNYTVMGDTVNLASRLEGINKEYGTRIIISEFTQAEVKNDFVTREVDRVRVKGKKLPVKIFELVNEGKATDKVAELMKYFSEGYLLYHEKRWQDALNVFNQALTVNGEDAVSKLYVERCTDYLSEPPPSDWDGVYVMKTK